MGLDPWPVHPRTAVFAVDGMVATSHPAASLAGVDMLRQGGSAMDAAVAAHLALAVVEPMSTGIGGDVFCLYAPGGAGIPLAYNGSGRAPAGLSAGWLRDREIGAIEPESAHAVTVPGAVEGFCRLHAEHGRLERGQVFAPAVRLAEEGYVVARRVASLWSGAEARLRARPRSRAALLRDGRAPRPGDRMAAPELAGTLRRIARSGPDAFYCGEIAGEMVSVLRAEGGVHAEADFAGHRGEAVQPISLEVEGHEVFECPPNGQGLTALQMLHVLAAADLRSMDPLGVDRLHLTLEAGRLAFADRAAWIADPSFAPVPVDELLSASRARAFFERIDPCRAMDMPPDVLPVSGRDTVYACAVDRDLNAASLISSLYHGFGSGILAPKSGVVLHCRGAGFAVAPGHPNCVAPGKRPLHTIIPGMLAADGRAVMPFGVMGADYQPWGHTHLLQNMLLYGMDPQEALNLPRFTHDGIRAVAEEGVPAAACRELARRGHVVATSPEPLGGGQAIWIDHARGVLVGGSEPRKDGVALGL